GCKEDCASCFSENFCTHCHPGHFLFQGKCENNCPNGLTANAALRECTECSTGCEMCVRRNMCVRCKADLYFHQGQCHLTCPRGFEPDVQLLQCNPQVHCEVGEWTDWGPCVRRRSMRTYRRGEEMRTRKVLRSPSVYGDPCPHGSEVKNMAGCGEGDCSVNAPAPTKLIEEGGDTCATDPSTPECAICLQSCIHPVSLPCCHVFCFLCVKGASWHSKRCALCRQEIPEDFLERPVLLSPEELKAAAAGVSRGVGTGGASLGDFAWYYEGRNGWWQYDERTSRELEEAFSKGRKSTEMLIAGFLYVADLENMVQYRRNEHSRRRKMKRDVVDIPKKGVAGLRLDPDPEPAPIPALPVRHPSCHGPRQLS
ncbi:hypothetical protein GBF38_005912, partial [Nibea albiflora]